MARTVGHLLTKKAGQQTEKVMSRVPPEDRVVEKEMKVEEVEKEVEVEVEVEAEVQNEQEVAEKEAGREDMAEDQQVAGGCQSKTTRRRCRPIASWLSWKAKTPFWRRLSRLARLPKPGGAFVNREKRWVIPHRRAVTRSPQVRESSKWPNGVSNTRKPEQPPKTKRGTPTKVPTAKAAGMAVAMSAPKPRP